MKDLRITEDGDLFLSPETGDVQITDSVVQAIIIRLKWFLNEWKIQPGYGLPYYDDVFIKRPSTTLVASYMRSEILTVDEVASVDSINVDIDSTSRKCTVNFKCTLKEGADTGQVAGEAEIYV